MKLDATDLMVGRFATVVAKKALLGESVVIVNCKKAVISGKRKQIIEWYKKKHDRGIPSKGPFLDRRPNMFVKRIIRGMLPYKKTRGLTAFKNIMCYNLVPENMKNEKFETMKEAHISKLPSLKYTTVEEICKQLGGKI